MMDVNNSATLVTPGLISELEYEKFLNEDVPVTAFLSILSIVGTVGNIHAFLVYFFRYRPSNHRTFVVSLAAIDCVASAISIPFEIFDIRYSYSFTSSIACKSFRMITHVVVVASGVLLGVIAVERFRKACKPLDPQLGPKGAIGACVITVVGSFLFSIPAFFLYDATQETIEDHFVKNNTYYLFENITNHDGNSTDFHNNSSSYVGFLFWTLENVTLYGYDCKVANKYKSSLFNKGYNGFYLLLSTTVFILCIIMYSFVGKALYKQVRFRKRAQSFKRRPSNSSLSSAVLTKLDRSTSIDVVEEESSSTGERRRTIIRKNSSIALHPSPPKHNRRMDRTRKITLMFLVATAVSYIGYVPNLVILLVKAMNDKKYKKIRSILGPGGTEVFLRMYFLNNVTNPLVYCFLDDKFRNECKMLYKKLVCWKK